MSEAINESMRLAGRAETLREESSDMRESQGVEATLFECAAGICAALGEIADAVRAR